MKFESVEQVSKFAADNNKVLVINDGDVLDVTTFAKHHPGMDEYDVGGAGLILNYKNKDIA